MSIKDDATEALARVPVDQHDSHVINLDGSLAHVAVYVAVNRLEWIEVLKEAKPTEPSDVQMVADLLMGAAGSPAAEVGILAVQALAVCNLAGE